MNFSEYLDTINNEEPINEAFSIDKTLKSTIKALDRFNTHFAQISSATDGICAYRLVTNKLHMAVLIYFDFKKNDVQRIKFETDAIEAGATYYDTKDFEKWITQASNEYMDMVNAIHETIELFKEVPKSDEDCGVVVDHIARKLSIR